MGDPAEKSALDALQDATMRQHLAESLAEAETEKIKVDELLEKLKTKLLGFHKTGEEDFSRKFTDSAREELAPYRGTVPRKPWKVE